MFCLNGLQKTVNLDTRRIKQPPGDLHPDHQLRVRLGLNGAQQLVLILTACLQCRRDIMLEQLFLDAGPQRIRRRLRHTGNRLDKNPR